MTEALFDIEPVCATCKGTKRVPIGNSGDERACPSCTRRAEDLPDPSRKSIGQFNRNAPDTQIAAAVSVYPTSGTVRRLVLDWVAGRGYLGATDEEIEQYLNLRHQSASARRNELVRDGWLIDSSRRRKTTSGREAVVWVLSQAAKLSDEEVTL